MMPQLSDQELADRCRSVGLRATPQRLAIYRTLLETDEHPSPEAVHRAVRERLPSLALGSVYKILDSLEERGLIEQLSLLAETKRYDANQAHHHHLVCTSCRRVIDVSDPSLDVALPKAPRGFIAREVRVQVVGLCADCHKEQAPRPPPGRTTQARRPRKQAQRAASLHPRKRR